MVKLPNRSGDFTTCGGCLCLGIDWGLLNQWIGFVGFLGPIAARLSAAIRR
jgi:hypothetical protein